MAQIVKNLPEMQETQVWFLGQEDLLEKGMAIHSSILAWRIPWTEEPGQLQSTGSKESDTTARPTLSLLLQEQSEGFLGGSAVKNLCQCERYAGSWVRQIPWRRKRHPIPVFLPGKSHGQRSPAVLKLCFQWRGEDLEYVCGWWIK